jgi:hypothetical protein
LGRYKAATTVIVRLHESMSMLYAVLSQVTIYGFRLQSDKAFLAQARPKQALRVTSIHVNFDHAWAEHYPVRPAT